MKIYVILLTMLAFVGCSSQNNSRKEEHFEFGNPEEWAVGKYQLFEDLEHRHLILVKSDAIEKCSLGEISKNIVELKWYSADYVTINIKNKGLIEISKGKIYKTENVEPGTYIVVQ